MSKKVLISIIFSFTLVLAQTMSVHTAGSTDKYNLEEIDSITFNIQNQIQPFENDSNTIALWHFNEGSGTSIINEAGPNGTLSGGVEWVNSKFGKAIKFDGIDDYGDCNINPPESNCTYEIWFKFDTVMTNGQWVYMCWGSNNSGLIISSGDPEDTLGTIGDMEMQANEGEDSVWTVKKDKWNYVAFVISDIDTLQALYINGEKIAEYTIKPTISWNTFWLAVNRTNGFGNYYKGLIDELKISDYAKTAEEIRDYWEGNN